MATATAAALLTLSVDRALRSASAVVCKPVTGSHVLRVDGYSHLIEAVAKDECVKSSAFDVGGHSWRLVLYPNGSSSSEHEGSMGVFFLHLESDPAGGRIWARAQFSILDQLTNPCPVRKTQCAPSISEGPTGATRISLARKNWKNLSIFGMTASPSSATPPSQLLRSALIIRSLFLETPHLELPSSPKS
ncbi:unnamed protein product [Urochloa humidicola]